MSTQPQQFPSSPQMRKEVQERKAARAAKRSDALYFAGATLVTAGAAMFRVRDGLIVAGAFLLLLPLMELIASFIRGLRTQPRSR